MRVRVLQDPAELHELSSGWPPLLEKSATRTPFQELEWLQCWWECFGRHAALRVLVAEEDGDLQGVLPLMLRPARRNGRRENVLAFIGAENFSSDYCDILAAAGDERVIESLLAAVENLEGWSMLDLFNLPSASPHRQPIEKFFGARGCFMMSRVLQNAPTRMLQGDQSDLLKRKSLRRHLNWFQRQGALECLHLTEPHEIRPWLPAFFDQHLRRWRSTGSSLFEDAQQQRFYETFVERMPGLCFTVILSQEKPIAFHLGFDHRRRFYWYKPAFEIDLKERSPGEVLLYKLFERALLLGLDEFDFTVGGEAFKYRFANLVRTTHRVRVYRRRSSYLLERARSAASKAKKVLLSR